jgi:hypothetical protein
MHDSRGSLWSVWLAITVVVICWAGCLSVAWKASKASRTLDGSTPISTAGQFGDTFGAVNALFTGFALAGLVYTAILQRQEIALQRQEIAGQTEDAKANEEARRTQSRELYLSARLNATVALLTSHEARAEAASRTATGGLRRDYSLQEAERESIKLRQHVAILLCEANQGFLYSPETNIREAALRAYIRQFLEELKWRLADERPKTILSDVRFNLINAMEELVCMIDTIGPKSPGIVDTLKHLFLQITLLHKKAMDNFANESPSAIYHSVSSEFTDRYRAEYRNLIEPFLGSFQ